MVTLEWCGVLKVTVNQTPVTDTHYYELRTFSQICLRAANMTYDKPTYNWNAKTTPRSYWPGYCTVCHRLRWYGSTLRTRSYKDFQAFSECIFDDMILTGESVSSRLQTNLQMGNTVYIQRCVCSTNMQLSWTKSSACSFKHELLSVVMRLTNMGRISVKTKLNQCLRRTLHMTWH